MGKLNTQNLSPPWKVGENGWPNGIPPANIGRPRSRIKALIKTERISGEDIQMIVGILLNSTETELKKIECDPELPSFLTIPAGALLEDKKKGRTETWERLMDRVLGKAVQHVTERENLSSLSDEKFEERKRSFLETYLRSLAPALLEQFAAENRERNRAQSVS